MTDTTVDTPAPVADVPSTPVEATTPDIPATVTNDTTPSSSIDILDGMNPEELTAIIEEAMKPRPTEPVSFPADTVKKDTIPPETTPESDTL